MSFYEREVEGSGAEQTVNRPIALREVASVLSSCTCEESQWRTTIRWTPRQWKRTLKLRFRAV